MTEKILFIMFPGKGGSRNDWNNNSCADNCLTKRLSKIGEIYTFTPLYNNIWYYANGFWTDKTSEYFGKRDELFEPNVDFNLEYFDVETFCRSIYDNVKHFDGKFILIGHSLGAVYVYKFSEMYKDRCLFAMLFDGSMIGKIALENHVGKITLREWFSENKSFDDITNEELQNVIENVKRDDKKSIHLINDLTYYKIRKQHNYDDIIHLSIPFVSFRNITKNDPDETNIFEEGEMLKKYNHNFEIIYLHDKTHFLHKKDDVIEIIIKKIIEHLSSSHQYGGNVYHQKYIKYKSKYLTYKYC